MLSCPPLICLSLLFLTAAPATSHSGPAGAASRTTATTARKEAPIASHPVSENIYQGELISFPGPWSFQLGKSQIIFVRDSELVAVSDNTDQKIDLKPFEAQPISLREICQRGKARGDRTM